ncbi:MULTISPECIES: fibrobacter succinogenes major paralogous domain-containing protein [unclassified Cobetia]|uniref:fibrobacter succinogenes major paralogous domain-containing protein n=1 Tax=unclassified Cobetia TaxID=2609414 RepID=UPI00178C9668|nr:MULTISPECIES: fibrobacter succinogenes major paralogous domain-containing protein [unclassified Cobetia]MBE2169919.1 fibrobacter succinogenes major paralogous domain-containing protein [Cobetia sp. 2AS1]MDH2446921.1 fibrobacter succinogenes major paralogous domain-containing protein [Cobetia sp. 2AS]
MKVSLLVTGLLMMIPNMSFANRLYDEIIQPETSIQDSEGNTYHTVKIGAQTWLADNLRTTRFQDGSPIRTAFIPEDDPDNLLSYGRLYDWHDVSDARNLCPAGWRVASDEDWKALERAIGITEREIDSTGWRGDDDIAITLKAAQPDSLLTSFDQARINFTGFSARPAGVKWKGWYITQGTYAEFWTRSEATPTKAFVRTLAYSWWNPHKGEIRRATLGKDGMFSVRCVKD